MEQENTFSRYNILWMIILCYLAPLIGISVYSSWFPSSSVSWNMLSLGFLLTASGSLAFFLKMLRWEESLNNPHKNLPSNEPSDPGLNKGCKQTIDPEDYDLIKRSLAEAQQTQIRLLSEIDILTEEIQKLSSIKGEIFQEKEKLTADIETARKTARQQLESQQNHIRKLQEAIADQKAISEKKQQQVVQLETKVADLTYEIKTLLQFAESRSSSLLSTEASEPHTLEKKKPVSEKSEIYLEQHAYSENHAKTGLDSLLQLKYFLDIAQKIKGSQRFGSQIYSFLDSPADSFSLDLRRLCERLRSETQSMILLYSPKDNHLLFSSNRIKTITGWSPEKFVQNFSEILIDESEWKQGVESLAVRSESQIQLRFKHKSGSSLLVNAHLGMIPTGIFKNHVIAVLELGSPL